MYLMITVISKTGKLKLLLNELKKIGIKQSIVIDSVGTTNIDEHYSSYRPIVESTLISISEVNHYRKTILSIVENEDLVKQGMAIIEDVLGKNMKKPNTGITFTIPILGLSSETFKK